MQKYCGAECVSGWYLFRKGSCWWGETLILALCRGMKFIHPQGNNLFLCYVTCSTYDRCYREQNWGQQNVSMSTLHNKTSWFWSGREHSKASCWFSFGFCSDRPGCQMGQRFCLVGKYQSGTRQRQPTNYTQATCQVWKGNIFHPLIDWIWTGNRNESIYCPLSSPVPRLPIAQLPCSLFRKVLSSNSLSKQITSKFLTLCHMFNLPFQKEPHNKLLTRTLVIKAL